MKRFILLSLVAMALVIPAVARAESRLQFVYRPELRQWVVVPSPVPATAPIVALTPVETIAKHQAMGHGYRGTRMAQGAAHCERMVQEARETLRRQS